MITPASMLFAHIEFEALPSGGLWWPGESTLLVADLHLEKGSYYASKGQMLPPYDSQATLDRLCADILLFMPARVICLGDSFHDPQSFARLHIETRLALRRLTRAAEWVWITGNHDPDIAEDLGGVSVGEIALAGVVLRHQGKPLESCAEISGHFHPKLRMQRRGRMIARRCYVRSSHKLILPGYGAYTGGLDVVDDAFWQLCGQKCEALVVNGHGLLRFDIAKLRAR